MSALHTVLEWLTALLFLLGATLGLLAAVGVLRLPDTFLRMQASSKASTLGLACLLAGAALQFTDVSSFIRLGSIAAFVMLTAPLSAHIVARTVLHRASPLWGGSVLNEYDAQACHPADGAIEQPDSASNAAAAHPPQSGTADAPRA